VTLAATYLGDPGRTGFYPGEAWLTPSSASRLALSWTAEAGGSTSSQPVVANDLVYWGSWDGYERATRLSGTPAWSTYVGRTADSRCVPPSAGPAAAATAAKVGGVPRLYVAGGDARLYSLNALTGVVSWRTSLGTPPGEFLWGSPLLYRGSVYVGISAYGDCSEGRGRLVELDASSGAIRHTLEIVPKGCEGGGVWGSIAVDQATGVLFVPTGDEGDCAPGEPNAPALLAVRASDLKLLSAWKVPRGEQAKDSDFGSTPTLFKASLQGRERTLVGIANKNGTYYAFDRAHLSAGPVWRTQIAHGGPCPYCGDGSIAPSAWDGQRLLVAGGKTEIKGAACNGSLRGLDPATGNPAWELCLSGGPVMGAVIAVRGVAIAAAGPDVIAVASASGEPLHTFKDPDRKDAFLGGPGIGKGGLFLGPATGKLYRLAVQ
jgi:polyvinyl alcohol dehydrogenase (cytochrome)